MTLRLLATALVILSLGAPCAWLASPYRGVRRLVGTLCIAACGLGAGSSIVLLHAGSTRVLHVAWSAPINELAVGIDPLSAFFLLCIFVVGGLGLVYAAGYFSEGTSLAWLHLLIVAMAAVVLARDVVVFLVAWEVMFLASYLLVTVDDHDAAVQRAGFIYLVASHIGVVLLFVLFGMLMRQANSLRFADFVTTALEPRVASLCFGVAVAGFGIKAGLWPLHGWLPEAHPAAPSPVSAAMSGVMIKMGIYGILRTLTFLGPPPAWWGITLLAAGALSAIAGVVLALAQRDLKRLLAYSSVENIGIIALGIGVGVLGSATRQPAVAIAGFAGALLHTLNHGLFKGLLFHVAGAVIHATGGRDLETQGGLLRRMPVTGTLALVGCLAIAGLPPLNGFIGELWIYVGALRHTAAVRAPSVGVAVLVAPVLALAGGLAIACFVRLFGIVFLGVPRSAASGQAHDVGGMMRVAMLSEAGACVTLGCLPVLAIHLVAAPAAQLAGPSTTAAMLDAPALTTLSFVAGLLIAAILMVSAIRHLLLRQRAVGGAVTWDCGYALTTPRMQYTATSFAQPALDPFVALLRSRVDRTAVAGEFPLGATEDVQLLDPGEAAVQWALGAMVAPLRRLRRLQRGPVQLYLLYVLVTLLVLLIWQVRP